MFETWVRAVRSVMPSSVAISLFGRPVPTSARTSCSRSVSGSTGSGLACAAASAAPAGGRRPGPGGPRRRGRPDRRGELVRLGVLEQEAGRAGLDRRVTVSSSMKLVRATISISGWAALIARSPRCRRARASQVHEDDVRPELLGDARRPRAPSAASPTTSMSSGARGSRAGRAGRPRGRRPGGPGSTVVGHRRVSTLAGPPGAPPRDRRSSARAGRRRPRGHDGRAQLDDGRAEDRARHRRAGSARAARQEPRGKATPTTGSNSIRIPARVPPIEPDPVRNPKDGMAAAATPGEDQERQHARRRRSDGSAVRGPRHQRHQDRADARHRAGSVVMACSRRHVRVAASGEGHEERLAGGGAEGRARSRCASTDRPPAGSSLRGDDRRSSRRSPGRAPRSGRGRGAPARGRTFATATSAG